MDDPTDMDSLPLIDEWFRGMPVTYLISIIISVILFLVIVGMTFLLFRNVHFHVPSEMVRSDLFFIIFMPMVVSACCLTGNILLRAAPLLYAVALTYLLITLHITISMIIRLFGNCNGLAKWLISNNKDIAFNTKPYCCCCHCLPTMRATPSRVRRLSYCVKQSPVVRIFLQILIMVMSVEEMQDDIVVSQVLNGVGVLSTLIAVYGSHIMVQNTVERLGPYNMFTIFKCVNISQMLFTLQKFVLDLIAKNGGMSGLQHVPADSISRFWHNFAMMVWLTIVTYVMINNIRPGKSKYFVENPINEDDEVEMSYFE